MTARKDEVMQKERPSQASAEIAEKEQAVTEEVIQSFQSTDDPRLKFVMESLVRHLHAFARDVRLTEAEWEAGIQFLTQVGQMCDERRQEFILLSDVLGLSMLTVGINHPSVGGITESTVFGPFFVEDAPLIESGGDIAGGAPGSACWIEGTVRSRSGAPIPGARIEVWEADEEGFYDVQYEGNVTSGRAHLYADEDGRFSFWSVKPAAYPIPDDGPVGQLLRRLGRGPMRPAHVHFMVSSEGYRTLITHIFVEGSPHLDDDAVFGVKASLIVPFERQEPGQGPAGRSLAEPWYRARFDIVLAEAPEAR
jgi:hydroxyquinol 1,2-dioxygenase